MRRRAIAASAGLVSPAESFSPRRRKWQSPPLPQHLSRLSSEAHARPKTEAALLPARAELGGRVDAYMPLMKSTSWRCPRARTICVEIVALQELMEILFKAMAGHGCSHPT